MFRRRKAKATRGHLGAFLGEGSEMDGKYTCTGTVMIDATFRGHLVSQDTLIVGERGVVHAEVQTATLVVRGAIVGNVVASERVELKAGARITGDIQAPVIVMEAGAVHDGGCRMSDAKPADPPLSLVVPLKA